MLSPSVTQMGFLPIIFIFKNNNIWINNLKIKIQNA